MSPIKTHGFIVPKMLTLLFVAVLIISGIIYVTYQARFLIEGPRVTLTDELGTVQSDRQVTITGNTANITALYLNGRPIVTNEEGAFSESLVLENGYTTMKIEAEDRYGRTTSLERNFVYSPEEQLFN